MWTSDPFKVIRRCKKKWETEHHIVQAHLNNVSNSCKIRFKTTSDLSVKSSRAHMSHRFMTSQNGSKRHVLLLILTIDMLYYCSVCLISQFHAIAVTTRLVCTGRIKFTWSFGRRNSTAPDWSRQRVIELTATS